MNAFLSWGTKIVVLALLAYSVGIITEQRKHLVTKLVLTFITVGIFLDITATVCMILGSSNSPFTLHGILGYSALGAMLVDAVLLWRHHVRRAGEQVPRSLHLYSRLAYIWWILAFVTGSVLVMAKYI